MLPGGWIGCPQSVSPDCGQNKYLCVLCASVVKYFFSSCLIFKVQ